MTEITCAKGASAFDGNPKQINFGFKKPAIKWQLKYGYPIIIAFLAIALSIVVYIIYHEYYQPDYQLTDFLPPEYVFAVEYNKNEDSLSKIQLMELFSQPTLKNIYLNTADKINGYLDNWPPELKSTIKTANNALLFITDSQNYGLVIKLKSKKQLAEIKDMADFDGIYYKIIEKNILAFTDNLEILEQMANTKIKPVPPFKVEISLSPWLNVLFNQTFFLASFDDTILSDLQTILNPLSLSENRRYALQFISQPHQLIVSLLPENFNDNVSQPVLNDYLDFLPKDYTMAFGFSEPVELLGYLNNKNLNDYFIQADSSIWIKNQFSLSQQLNSLSGSIVVAVAEDSWSIVTNFANLNPINDLLKNYLAQFNPISQTMVLPDGSTATEIVANPAAIIWNETKRGNWQIFSYRHPQKNSLLGYAINGEKLIVSNKIDDFGDFISSKNCDLTNLSTFVSLKPQYLLNFTLNPLIQNFANISAISSTDGQIKLCFDLK